MDAAPLAIILGLGSAVTLAAANMSIKMGADILAGRAVLSLSAALMIAPAALLVPFPDVRTWLALAATLPVHFTYQMCLVRALQRADLSLVFPVMRGAAPLLTACVALLLLSERLSPLAWVGLILATAALVGFVLPPAGAKLRAHPDARALGWAAATAIAIAFYNTLDARGTRIAPDPFTFIVWLFLLDPIGVTTVVVLRRRNVAAAMEGMRWRYGAAAGALSIISFGSALYAFTLMETAKVSALRETSVIFAALMGSRFLGEGFGARRFIAATVLAAGLVLMQFGG
jgi:drug/metabolite transporter (DMT)-like permease